MQRKKVYTLVSASSRKDDLPPERKVFDSTNNIGWISCPSNIHQDKENESKLNLIKSTNKAKKASNAAFKGKAVKTKITI